MIPDSDGVVVAQDGDLVLAKTADLSNASKRSAVAVTGSEQRLTVTRGAAHAQAWLELLRGGASHSVFRVVSTLKSEPLAPGTKLIIER